MKSDYAQNQFRKRQEELFVKNLSHVIEEYGLNTHYSPDSLAIFCLQSINSLNQVTEGHNLRMAHIPKQEPAMDDSRTLYDRGLVDENGVPYPVEESPRTKPIIKCDSKAWDETVGNITKAWKEPRNVPGDCIRG